MAEESASARDIDYRARAERVPLGPSTLAAVKIRPGAFRNLSTERSDGASSESSGPSHSISRLVASLLDSMTGVRRALESGDESFVLEHVAADGPVYVVLLERTEADLLRRLRDGVPMQQPSEMFRGSAARIVLPTKSPEALVEEIDRHCRAQASGWKGGECRALVRTSTMAERGFVVVDLLYGARENERETYRRRLEEDPPRPSGYFDRLTPAVKAFVGGGGAVAAYAETSDLWKVSLLRTLPSMAQRIRSLEGPERERRFREVHARAVRIAGRSAPEAREFEDASLLVHPSRSGPGFAADVVQTYTTQGRRVAEAGRIDARLPTIGIEEPDVDLEWAFDTPSALRRAKRPGWMQRSAAQSRGSGGVEFGSFRWVDAWLSHPHGTLKEWTERPLEMAGRARALRRLVGLRAARAKFRVQRSEEAPLGVTLMGAAVAEIPRESNLDATVESLVAIGKSVGLPVRMRTHYDGQIIRMKVTFDASMQVFGPEQPVGARRIVRARLGESGGGSRDVASGSPIEGVLAEIANVGDVVELQRATNATARMFRVRFGTSDSKRRLELPTAAVDLQSAEPPPSCFEEVVERSRSALVDRVSSRFESAFGIYARALPELERKAEDCEVGSPYRSRLREVMAANWVLLGALHERLRHWGSAAEAFRRACKRGDESACDRKKEAQRAAGRLQLPDVGRVSNLRESLRKGVLELGRDGLRAGGKHLASLEALAPEDEEASPKRVVGEIEQRAGPYDYQTSMGLVYAAVMGVDTSIPAGTVEEVARQVYEARLSNDDLRRVTRLSNVQRSNQSANAILFLVRTHEQHAAFRSGGAYYIAVEEPGRSARVATGSRLKHSSGSTAEDLELSIEVRTDGFVVRRRRRRLEPIDGCPEDGPTVCVDVQLEELQSRLAAYLQVHRAQRSEAARRAAARVSAAYPYLKLHRVLKRIYEEETAGSERPPDLDEVAISVADRLPFEVVAKTMATAATRSFRDDMDTSEEFFADQYRSAPMFDRIELDLND